MLEISKEVILWKPSSGVKSHARCQDNYILTPEIDWAFVMQTKGVRSCCTHCVV